MADFNYLMELLEKGVEYAKSQNWDDVCDTLDNIKESLQK